MASKYKKFAALAVMTTLLGLNAQMAFAEEAEPLDETAPSVVENLAATPGDTEVSLEWDPATDNVGVTGYYLYIGVNPADGDEDDYEFGSVAIEDGTTSYTVDNLTNNLTYYFAVSAFDAEGNESEEYSEEVEATPEESEVGDFTAPTVSDAEALTSTLVMVEFSEEVALPEDGATAFGIESSDGSVLNVIDAYVSSDDSTIVMLVTSDQVAGSQYILTAGISVTDMNDNPLESGTSDTAVFTGSSLSEIEVPEDDTSDDEPEGSDTEFELDDVEATELTEVELNFSQDVSTADASAFVIQLADDASEEIEVLSVIIDLEDPSEVILITEEMEAGADYIISVETDVLNADGESISLDGNEMEFEAPTLDLSDLIPPENVTSFLAELSNESTILLSWNHSEDSEGDLLEYFVYQSIDGGLSFGEAMEILAEELGDAPQYEVDGLTPGETYTFKVTARDENGNESDGEMTTITLPESGPGMMAMGALSLLGAGFIGRRKKE
jgi:hypothetical protein